MMSTVASSGSGSRSTIGGVDQHADRNEEQHGEGVAQGQRFLRRALAELGFAQDHAGEEGAERERHVEQDARAESDAERDGQHAKPEQLARPRVHDSVQDPGDHALADHQHHGDEGCNLAEGDQDGQDQRAEALRRRRP